MFLGAGLFLARHHRIAEKIGFGRLGSGSGHGVCRGGAGGRRGGDGLGIGLAIAKSIVERHGGRVSLDNGPDRGAVLRIALPVVAEARR